MKIQIRRLLNNSIDEAVFNVNESVKHYSSDDYDSDEISHIIFDKLVGNGVTARIIKYTFNSKPFYSVQYLKRGRWFNFDYKGLDMFFHPIYHKTLDPTNVVEEKEGY